KVLTGEPGGASVARFRTEAEAAARLRHPHIVQVYEFGEAAGRPFISLEYCDGGSLNQRLAGAPQPARPAAELLETLARAIHVVHERGIVHRDLKPANILLSAPPPGEPDADAPLTAAWLYGEPKVTDFGVAKLLDDDSGHTRTGTPLGTPS